jgi:hypothetical protein
MSASTHTAARTAARPLARTAAAAILTLLALGTATQAHADGSGTAQGGTTVVATGGGMQVDKLACNFC